MSSHYLLAVAASFCGFPEWSFATSYSILLHSISGSWNFALSADVPGNSCRSRVRERYSEVHFFRREVHSLVDGRVVLMRRGNEERVGSKIGAQGGEEDDEQ
ncbi:hypothetical protein CRG98_011600 [Punica granatum]|uniref:Uncharacterized protein n=1 Tax=Punica granatum TaxID=22663 RepID=A0A2I0KHM0_PUNGR|nr:hypothetical protein CRG98_011600 [Punica granatum]